MTSSQRSIRSLGARPWPATLAVAALLGLAGLLASGPAAAHLDPVQLSGVTQLDSATSVQQNGATPQNWRTASPLAVPDRFGPGAVLGVGNIRMKIVNNGLLGNPYGNTSSDPAGQWPGSSGVEFLNAIYFAVGAVNPAQTDPSSIRRVSWFQEWRPPSLEAVDRIYRAFDGIINGARFVNDDGDVDRSDPDLPPKIDEDFLDGRDNDGDGLIDEDHAAIGQQEFSYVMRDDTREAVNTVFNEKHIPLGLEARVRAWAYSIQGFQDFNVCEYRITNVGRNTLDSLTLAWLVDMDSGPIQLSPFWTDDIDFPQYPNGEFEYRVGGAPGDLPDPNRKQFPHDPSLDHLFPPSGKDSALCPRIKLRVNAFTVGDQDGDNGRTLAMGTFMLIDHTVDPTGINGPRRVGFRSFRSTSGSSSFTQGGLPRTDQERFQSMVSHDGIDPETGFISASQGAARGDFVEWLSIGPWRNFEVGQTITATIAFGVRPATAALANSYPNDYQRYRNSITNHDNLYTAAELIAKYPSLANALSAQVAFEGINETREGYTETQPISGTPNGRDFHGRETGIRLARGTSPTTIVEDCEATGGERREVIVTDRAYSWFNFDCDFCTGVWDATTKRGLFHKSWNASAPPPNPSTNVSSLYNFTDNPERRVIASGDRVVHLGWDNISEVTADPKSRWLDFRGYSIWKVGDWIRDHNAAGPSESEWRLLGEFRMFDYFTGSNPGDVALEHNYSKDATGAKTCPLVFIPNYFDQDTKLYGKAIPICLDRFDIWNKQSGEVVKPDWTTPCEVDTSLGIVPLEINTGELEWGGPNPGASAVHMFAAEGTYPYMCMRHPRQLGTVNVVAGGADSATVQILNSTPTGFVPSIVTIRPGGFVRWANLSAQNHAVQSDRHCKIITGVIVHRRDKENPLNLEPRIRYPIGRYQYIDHEVKNGFVYFYSITAFDSTTDNSVTTELGGRRSAVESEEAVPQASVDAGGKQGVWVVPNPYRGYSVIRDRPSAWDLIPNASDPTGTHIDFFGMPAHRWTLRIYTVSGDLVQTILSTDAVNESVRQPVRLGPKTYPGYNRQQDNANDGQASWNLISRNGQDIVSGIYLFTVESAEGSQRGKFVVIR